ncbi:MAG: hypothetical protein V1708_00585 [Candidatus Micrarchaeota archaeon]
MKSYRTNNLAEIRAMAYSGQHAGAQGDAHGGHGHGPAPKPPHVQGANPLMDDYMRPDSWQAKDVLPQYAGKKMLPVYLPTTAKDIQGNGKPVHSISLMTRGDLIDTQVANENYKDGSIAAIYRTYFMAWLSLGLMVLALGFNIYIAAIFAYLAGYYWSEKDLTVGWSIQWWKGKTLIHTT